MLAHFMPYVPRRVVERIARRYIAGSSLDEAVRVTQSLNTQHFLVAISYLGEHATRRDQCVRATEMYASVLDAIDHHALAADLSVKPTQLGLVLDFDAFIDNAAALAKAANHHGAHLRLDMEESSCVERTLEGYERLRHQHDNVGVVLQASLRRSYEDAVQLSELQPDVRVCKGAYREPTNLAYQGRDDIRRNFLAIVNVLLKRGAFVEIATHDDVLIESSKRLIEAHRVPRERCRFSVLLGVRPDRALELVQEGYEVLVYVGFGEEWYPYVVRRARKNPRLVWTVAKSLLTGR